MARLIAVLGAIGALVLPASASAALHYEVDGLPAPKKAALDLASADNNGGGCSVIPAPDGTVACFTSEAKRDRTIRVALISRELPPGFGVEPSSQLRADLLGRLMPTASASSKKPQSRARARAAACQNQTTNHIFTDPNFGGVYGYYGAQTWWFNLYAPWLDSVSSFRHAQILKTAYADGFNGTGPLDLQGFNGCSTVTNLSPSGWDNRYSSLTAGY